jgi:hypothetical protein
MTGQRRWSRRRFLHAMTAVAALAATGGWWRWSARPPAAEWLASTPATGAARASAAVVGREYLRAREDVVAAETLVAEIASRVAGLEDLASTGSIEQARAAVAEAVVTDFAALDLVRVRGWILSATEARVCGLVALATDPSLTGR